MSGDSLQYLAKVIAGIEGVELRGLCRPPNYAEWFPNNA